MLSDIFILYINRNSSTSIGVSTWSIMNRQFDLNARDMHGRMARTFFLLLLLLLIWVKNAAWESVYIVIIYTKYIFVFKGTAYPKIKIYINKPVWVSVLSFRKDFIYLFIYVSIHWESLGFSFVLETTGFHCMDKYFFKHS